MNRGQKVLAGLLGVVAVELAVLDYAAMELMRNGVTIELDSEEKMEEAMNVALEDMIEEGE